MANRDRNKPPGDGGPRDAGEAWTNYEPQSVEMTDQMVVAYRTHQEFEKLRNGSKALALYRDIKLRPPGWKSWTVGGLAFLGIGLTVGILPGLIIGGGVVLIRNFWETGQLRSSSSDLYLRTEQATNLWVRMAYDYMRMAIGYNARRNTVMMLKKDNTLREQAAKMNRLLAWVYPQMLKAFMVLRRFQPARTTNLYGDTQEHNDRLREIDPLGTLAGDMTLVWLPIPGDPDEVPISEFDNRLNQDLYVIGGLSDAHQSTSATEDRFEDLKRKLDGEDEPPKE